jgi:predicted O-methyltransferase YrrM
LNNTFFQIKSFFTYLLDNVDEHSLHSPFFYKFYTEILKKDQRSERVSKLEGYRKTLLKDTRSITVEDLGAGSAYFKSNSSRKVRDIARTSLSRSKFSRLFSRIIQQHDYKNVIELGTSLGLNALYLGLSHSTQVRTFEGSKSVAGIAEQLFISAGADNIRLIPGNIDSTLPAEIKGTDVIDFALIDANHRYTPTMNYFDMLASKVSAKSIIALDDIHASEEMEKAWNAIRQDGRVHSTADLYRCGLVFFDPSLNKQHVVLRF